MDKEHDIRLGGERQVVPQKPVQDRVSVKVDARRNRSVAAAWYRRGYRSCNAGSAKDDQGEHGQGKKRIHTCCSDEAVLHKVYSSQFTNAEVAAASTYGLGDDLANAILPILRSIGGAKNAEIHIDNYLSPGTAQLGESIVKLNDIYGKRLGK